MLHKNSLTFKSSLANQSFSKMKFLFVTPHLLSMLPSIVLINTLSNQLFLSNIQSFHILFSRFLYNLYLLTHAFYQSFASEYNFFHH